MARAALLAFLFAVLVAAGCAPDDEELSAVAARPGVPVATPAAPAPPPAKAGSADGPPLGRAPVSDPGTAPYGSGRLGPWEGKGRALSTMEQFRTVASSDGMLMVGDSIADATARECAARFGAQHGLATAVNTWNSRPTAPAADWIVAHPELIPGRGIVVVAGANDIFDPADWWRQVERVVAAAAGKPVYWLTVHVDRWSMPADVREADRQNSDWINDQLRWQAGLHPQLVLVDWQAAVASAETPLLEDGVHPSVAGVDAWCGLVESALGLDSR